MIEREKIIDLYDIYKELLTTKQREYFENYYFEDLSLSEIAENLNVSKSFVGKTLNIIEKKLNTFESKLNIYELNKKIEEIASSCPDKSIKDKLKELIK